MRHILDLLFCSTMHYDITNMVLSYKVGVILLPLRIIFIVVQTLLMKFSHDQHSSCAIVLVDALAYKQL